MKNKIFIISFILIVFTFNACNKDFLEKTPLSEYSGDVTWNDLSLMETFVNDTYNNIPHGFTELMLSSICDETILTYDGGASNVTKSLLTPSDLSVFKTPSGVGQHTGRLSWDWTFKNIRKCNLFLQQVEKNTYINTAFRDRLIGEVYFLRAYCYHNLVFLYGGVPLITKAYELSDTFLEPRKSFEECIKFISEDCDKAAALLPISHTSTNYGRATKGAAMALKSRVLLWAASDLYHKQSLWSKGYANPELVGYVGGDRTQRWKLAKDAAKAVMDMKVYDMYKKEPAAGDNIANNYEEIFVLKSTSEDIFIRSFINKSAEGYNVGTVNTPNGWGGYGGNTPTSQTADSYAMSDGSKFDWNNPTHKADPYKNREPRFYANINYEGAKWLPRESGAKALDPVGVIQTAYYQKTEGGPWIPGLDTRDTPYGASEDGSYTGYNLRKFLDPAINPFFTKQECPWRFIRYTEIVLNYAEACNELGEDIEALKYINMIRHRAGLPDISGTGNDLREKLRNERKIELMFEDQRFFDIRRWMIAPQALSTDALGVDIRYYYGATSATYSFIPVRGRAWKDSHYFLPISIDEMNRNKALIQNPLY